MWVRIRGQISKCDVVVAVCYIPPDQEKETDETLFRQLEKASPSQALILMDDFNHLDVCWNSNTAGGKKAQYIWNVLKAISDAGD